MLHPISILKYSTSCCLSHIAHQSTRYHTAQSVHAIKC
uniref:Uncharacterized protein n=1 Tax=Anguilla anguilla TaxID=7936 RepID=A0A0E9QXM3_ANGAN